MKKITGKVVSLVLALALVVTSFSANFAFATTKSMAGNVSKTFADDIYLCNGGIRTVNLNSFLITNSDFKMETKNHKTVDDIKVSSISHVSGDKLVSLDLKNDGDDAQLKLRSSTKNGTEVIQVLFKASYTDDDGNEYNVKASQKLTVHVFDKGQIAFGKATPNTTLGKGVDNLDDMPMTAQANVNVGIYNVNPNGTTDAFAVFTPATNVYFDSGDKGFKDSGFVLDITSGDSDFHFMGAQLQTNKDADPLPLAGAVPATIGKLNSTKTAISADASTGNVTLTAKKLVADGSKWKASNDSDDKYTLKTKIVKKVDVATLLAYNGTYNSNSNLAVNKANGFTIKKTDGKTILDGVKQFDGKTAVVTDKEVNFPTGTGNVTVDDDSNLKKVSGTTTLLTIDKANVGSVDLDGGSVVVDEGKVGDITTDKGIANQGTVTVSNGAKVGNINACDALDSYDKVIVDGATTGTVKTDGEVEVKTSNDDDVVTTGVISASKTTVNADEAKITVAGIKATADESNITLYNSDSATMDVKSIDFDNYDVTLNLGDENDDSNYFNGTIAAPVNATSGTIQTKNDDTNVTITGNVDVNTISVDTGSNLILKDSVKAKTVDGDGIMTIVPGKLYVSESASGVKLKLNGNVTAGTLVFKADAGNVDTEDFNTYGYTLAKSTASAVDSFKITSVTFAGLQINKTSSSIAKGYSETFTASAYPTGTSLPTGYTVKWDFDGSSDVFTMTSTGNTATIKVNSIDSTFESQNVGTLTAALYDADGYELDDYDVAKCLVTATAVPAATSDTTSALSVAKGASYTMKVTSASQPTVTTGSAGVFSVALSSKNGNAYLYKLTATGNAGQATGVYLNGTKIFVATVKASTATCDTTKATTVKGTYQFKVTDNATPTVSVGGAAFKLTFVSKNGNAYLYKITSAGAKGASAGVYVNGSKVFVATVG